MTRLLMAIELDGSSPGDDGVRTLAIDPKPLLQFVRERLAVDMVPTHSHPTGSWPAARRPDSAYAAILERIRGMRSNVAAIDLDRALLDEVGAPSASLAWPIDCVVRLPAPDVSYSCVLEEIRPAGSLDARFVAALQSLRGPVPHRDWYARFLAEVERRTGTMFVELLVPPLTAGAANAVRRPMYPRAWTGDPDLLTYVSRRTRARHIPLDRIMISRRDGRPSATADGALLAPIYHATRVPLPPWDGIADILLATTPARVRGGLRRLSEPIHLFGGVFMPRITVDGGLVVAGAQWKLPPEPNWARTAPLLDKVRGLSLLRGRYELPRWIFLSAKPGEKAVPCDLESIRAVDHLERAWARTNEGVVAVEMLPPPDKLLAERRGGSVTESHVSAIMLRLPIDEPCDAMAARAALLFAE